MQNVLFSSKILAFLCCQISLVIPLLSAVHSTRNGLIFYLLNDGVLNLYQATSRGANRISELPILIPDVRTMGRSDTIAGAD